LTVEAATQLLGAEVVGVEPAGKHATAGFLARMKDNNAVKTAIAVARQKQSKGVRPNRTKVEAQLGKLASQVRQVLELPTRFHQDMWSIQLPNEQWQQYPLSVHLLRNVGVSPSNVQDVLNAAGIKYRVAQLCRTGGAGATAMDEDARTHKRQDREPASAGPTPVRARVQ
jgi:hypothetical protein